MPSWNPEIESFFKRRFPHINFGSPVGNDVFWPAAFITAFGINEEAGYYGFDVDLDFLNEDPNLFLPKVRVSSVCGAEVCLNLIEDFLNDHKGMRDQILTGKALSNPQFRRDGLAEFQDLVNLLRCLKADRANLKLAPISKEQREHTRALFEPTRVAAGERDVSKWLQQWQPVNLDLDEFLGGTGEG